MSRKITKEELIERFNKLHKELGRIPNRDEMGHREPIKRLYGNYNNFVREMGYLPNLFRTKEDYINFIQDLSKELGKTPSIFDLEGKGVYALSIYNMFGSYNNLLEEAGFETRGKIYTNKTDEELLLDYINISNKLGRWVKTRELESIDIYENRFGSIIEVRKLVANDDRLKIKDKAIIKPLYKKYTDDDIDKYIKDAMMIYGNEITKSQFAEYLKSIKGPSINTVTKRRKHTSFREMIKEYIIEIDL
ncbi:hypothetical protein [Tissierella praeacuta]|uniref:homing endonuclease associated repeat-containing protein n=1 Tax=Tissierella praeacuta TaxID=43131 RepID=UPI003340808C